MKILRSQFLKLQNTNGLQTASSKHEVEKTIPQHGREHAKGNQGLGVKRVPPVLLSNKKDIVCFDGSSAEPSTNVKILIDSVDKSLQKLNVVVEFTDMSSLWLTNVYKTYENDLWWKKPRLDIHGNKKWWFYCGFCNNAYRSFFSVKNHLNLHLDLYPYVCTICTVKYTNRKSAIAHLKTKHQIQRERYNDFLIS